MTDQEVREKLIRGGVPAWKIDTALNAGFSYEDMRQAALINLAKETDIMWRGTCDGKSGLAGLVVNGRA